MNVFKKILGIFCVIMAVACSFLLFTNYHPAIIAELIMWLIFSFLLFRKKKDKAAEPVNSYIETDNMVYRTNAKPITDAETIYLQQTSLEETKEKTRAKMLIPQHIRHIQESYKIMYDTADPETLCSRYKYALNLVQELKYFATKGWYNDPVKLNELENLFSNDNYCKIIQHSYMQYMEKAKSELKTETGIEKRKQKFLDYVRQNVDTQILMRLSIF